MRIQWRRFRRQFAREVVAGPTVWKINKNGDKVAHPVAFSPSTINTILDDNKGDSAWPDVWHPDPTPGAYIKRTFDKSRLAIAYGVSTNEIYRLDIQMVNDASKLLN